MSPCRIASLTVRAFTKFELRANRVVVTGTSVAILDVVIPFSGFYDLYRLFQVIVEYLGC